MAGEISGSAERDLIARLRHQVESLQNRVEELEAQNSELSSQLSSCCCNKIEDKVEVECMNAVEESRDKKDGGVITGKKKALARIPGYDVGIMKHHSKRYVALKVMYFGQRFYGFASEAQMDPTVESEIFKALEKTRLLVDNKKESQYSRCGRTDKGVSSVGQVISLFLRSNLKQIGANNIAGDSVPQTQTEGEIDYVNVLNRVLPNDIRILGWAPVSTDFSARFTCLAREYKYFFWRGNLNISAMEHAGKKLIGEHDFRNFCKMDAANVHNYKRRITSVEISSYDMRFEGNELCVVTIKGSAFLWHQVRCIVSVLFMIGGGLESISVVDVLLDTEKTPRKPQYSMAPEIPLVLHSCEFKDVNFTCSSDAWQTLCTHLENECRMYQLQSAIFHDALLSCLSSANRAEHNSSNNGKPKKPASHVPLMSRPTEPSYDERCAKLNSRR